MLEDQELTTSRRTTLKLLGVGTLLPATGARTSASRRTGVTDAESGGRSRTQLEDVVVADESTVRIGPGVELTTFSHLDANGWVAGTMLDLDLGAERLSTDVLSPGLTESETVSEMVTGAEATCGVNGDFFEISTTKAPIGAEISGGTIDKSSDYGFVEFVVDRQGIGHVLDVLFDGTAMLPDEEIELEGLNSINLSRGSVGVFTHEWGDATRIYAVEGAPLVTEVTVRDGEVVSVSYTPDGEGPVGPGELVLVGREDGATPLTELSEGDRVTVDYAPVTQLDAELDHGLGGNVRLVTDGEENPELSSGATAPRTAIGVADEGQSVIFLAVDGRQEQSRGLSYARLAEYMTTLGAVDAINLDGGGSTTMVARERGREPAVQNEPSAGSERPVSNGVGVFLEAETGGLAAFAVEARRDADELPGVFTGLTRDFVAHAHDDVGDPVDVEPSDWRVSPGGRASVDGTGVVTGEEPGEIRVRAKRGGHRGEIDAVVLDNLVRVVTDPRRFSFSGEGEQATLAVWGRDRDGNRGPIEPRDVGLTYDDEVVSVRGTDDGEFEVTAETDEGSTTIEVTVDGARFDVPVAVGGEEESSGDPIRPEDRLILQSDSLDAWNGRFRFAALAGGGVSAGLEGRPERLARRALCEAAANDPDFLVICGNFVENGLEENLKKAMELIEEEVGDTVPVQYVPGPRELEGDSDLENFRSIVGEPRTTFDYGAARFVLLNSATGSFRTADFEQLVDLEETLADAAGDPDVENVVVLAHHAVLDPFSIDADLADEMESEMVASHLANVVQTSGTEVAYVGGRGATASVDRYDGVAHVNAGTIDEDIESAREDGDARSWIELAGGGTDSDAWYRAEVRPLFETITLSAPDVLQVGETGAVSATGHQEAAEDVPVDYPLTARWSGSDNLFVGAGSEADEARDSGDYDAILDFDAGELEALADGTVTIRVESNDVRAETNVDIVTS